MDTQAKQQTSPIMHNLTNGAPFPLTKVAILLFVISLLGIGTGYFLAQGSNTNGGSGLVGKLMNNSAVEKGKIYGEQDEKTFKMHEVPEGVLKPGGIEGEGEYHLERDGGPARFVYLTSSLVDLSQFVNRKVKVWGQTQKAEKAGWLMDVGRVQVVE